LSVDYIDQRIILSIPANQLTVLKCKFIWFFDNFCMNKTAASPPIKFWEVSSSFFALRRKKRTAHLKESFEPPKAA
jgi:hypothetical protein